MVAADESEQRARLARLQRRLYAPDATDEDRARYVALRDELAAAAPSEAEAAARSAAAPPPTAVPREPGPPAEPGPASIRAARRRPLLIGAALLGAAGLCAAVAVLQTPPSDPAPVARTSEALPSQAALPAQSRAPQLSERFNGDAGTPMGTTVEVAVDGSRVLAQRFSGSGPALVPLITGGAPLDGGLLTVTLRSTSRESVTWQTEPGASGPLSTVTGTPETPTVGLAGPGSTSVRYRGAPPPRITVEAPAGTGWTLVVAFSR